MQRARLTDIGRPRIIRITNISALHEMVEGEGKWEQIKGQVKARWGKFTNDDILYIKEKLESLYLEQREELLRLCYEAR